MNMKETIKIFSETGCIPHEVLWKYRQGTLSAKEKHEVELHLTDCELCSDALSGMLNMETDTVVAELRKSVRTVSAPKKVIRFYDFRIVAAAAAVALIVVFTYVINSTNRNQNKEIALLSPPKEKINEESFSVSNSQPTDEGGLLKKKTEDLTSSKAVTKTPVEQKIISKAFSPAVTDSVTTQEQTWIAESDGETARTTPDNNNEAANEKATASDKTESLSHSGNIAPAAATMDGEINLPESANKSRSKKSDSSKELNFYNLKVAKNSCHVIR